MQALFFDRHGGIENLKYGPLPPPSVGPGEALIRVGAAALNHLDLWVLNGWRGLKLPLPHVGGSDIAGTIEQLGPENQQCPFLIGDRVAVNPGITGPNDEWVSRGEESVSPGYKILGENCWGGFAEFVVVPTKNLYPIPADITFQQAAAALLCSLTAWRMLGTRGRLKSGESVLVVGAGGGLNSISIQIARHLGATVYALSSSDKKLAQAAKLGAQFCINYKSTPDWSKEVLKLTNGRGIDLIIDNVGAATFPQSLKAAVRGGRIVTVGNTAGPTLAIDNRYIFGKQLSIIGSTMGSRADFESVLPLIWNKTIVAPVDRELPLKDGVEGYRALERGEQFGKIVLVP
jgi:NADPH:quinone reductase-like Zn-dependent oxidoreductase